MALTLVQRETFQNVGTLTSASPGNLGTVDASANFYKRGVGPKVTGDTSAQGKGWSTDGHISAAAGANIKHTFTLTGGAISSGMFSAFYYFDTISISGTQSMTILKSTVSNGNQLLYTFAKPSSNGNFWYNRNGLWSDTDSGKAMPVLQWFEIRQEWTTSGSNCTSISCDFRICGTSTWTNIYSTTTSFNMGGSLASFSGGWLNASGSESFPRKGRYGMPSVYTMGSWSDRLVAISDVIDPPTGPFSWYVDPVSGSDTNDGLSTSTAWKTASKINAESSNCGLFPTTAGYANGDTLTIDTTSGNLILDSTTQSLWIQTRGLNVVQLGGGLSGTGEIQAWKQIANNSFSLTSGTTKVYQTTDTDTSSVVWENDKWMNHPTGANLAAVQSTLESTPGSFWTDGTTMYLHPFGDTNPTTDGKVYTRSYYRNAGDGALQISVPDTRMSGLRVRKTCIAHKSTNDPGANYCFYGYGSHGGTNLYENCYGDYGSKHVFGFTDNDVNRQTTVNNCQAEQGSPYSSQSTWVDYSSQSTTGTATTVYNNCVTNRTTGLIGSTTGNTDPSNSEAWLCHNNGSSNYQFATITFNNCTLNGKIDTFGAVYSLRFNGGTCSGGVPKSPDALFSQVRVSYGVLTCDQTGGATRVRNCIVTPGNLFSGGGEASAQGVVDYQGCLIDMRSTNSNTNDQCLFKRSGSLNLIWKNNLFIGSPTYRFGILNGNSLTVSPTFNNNAYILNGTTSVAYNYNDGSTTSNRSLAQWLGLGFDSGSITPTLSTSIDSSYKPVPGSPLIRAGVNIGPLTDFAGKTVFNPRSDIGAYQFVPSTLFFKRITF